MKKKIYIIMALALVVSVSALLYSQTITTTIDVEQPISVEGVETTINGMAGDPTPIIGELITVSNVANFDVNVQVTNDAIEEIETSYVGELELTEKTVNFNENVWLIPGDADKVNVKYTMIGNKFTAEVTNPITGYELIYYKDNSDRFNSPAQAILVEDVDRNLPYDEDKNSEADGTYDYCETGEYDTCHGAKIWYVPSDAINGDNIDWGRASDFYYETSLIQFNSDGKLTVYPSPNSIEFVPEFTLDIALETGEYTVTTTVTPVE